MLNIINIENLKTALDVVPTGNAIESIAFFHSISKFLDYIISENMHERALLLSYIRSTIHAVIVTYKSGRFLYKNLEYYDVIQKDYGIEYDYITSISAGYMLSDLIMPYKPLKNEEIIHHISTLLAICVGKYSKSLQWMMIYGLFTEISVPFVNLRWLLDTYFHNYTKLIIANGITMWTLHGIFRVIILYFLFNKVKHYNKLHTSIILIFCLLNSYWFYLMSKGIYLRLNKI